MDVYTSGTKITWENEEKTIEVKIQLENEDDVKE
jgi:hypothetical protein